MLNCPICSDILSVETADGWLCQCGEIIPFGFEIDSEGSCETCPVKNCPKRK